MWNMWLYKNYTRMRHIKYQILENLCKMWESGKISGIDFMKGVFDLVINSAHTTQDLK